MEKTKSNTCNSKLARRECKFCKCQNYVRPNCTIKDVDSKLVKQDVVISCEGDKGGVTSDKPNSER